MLGIVICIVFCLDGISSQSGDPIYTIVAPKVIRPNLDYNVAVSVSQTSKPLSVAVSILGERGEVVPSRVIRLDPDSTNTVVFEMGQLTPGPYNLTVRGIGDYVFLNTTDLIFIPKSLSVFIQTDKPVYKPGERVMFRVLVVNPLLRPEVTGSIDVQASDGNGNVVRKWPPSFTTKGVFQEELMISKEPVLGNWNISVDILGQHFTKQFTVAEYVLPKFDVSVALPDFATMDNPDIIATVLARYKYGKAIKGEAKIRVSPLFKSHVFQPFYEQPHYKTVPINGRVDVPFSLVKDLQLKSDRDFTRDILFEVTVTETKTNRVQNTSSVLTLYKFPINIDLIQTSDSFKPGLEFKAYVKVTHPDGEPVDDGLNQLTFRHSYASRILEDNYIESKHWIPGNGIVEVSLFPPLDEVSDTLTMEAQYLDVTATLGTVTRAYSPSNTYVKATLLTRDPKVNFNVRIGANATIPIGTLTYQIFGRGNVVFAQSLQGNGLNATAFSFPCVPALAPTARVVVYMVLPSGEVVADALEFDVLGVFQNKISVSTDVSETAPGNRVTVRVKTSRDAFVGITGVDQAVTKLKSESRLSQKMILNELQSYDTGLVPFHSSEFSFTKAKRSIFWPGSSAAADVFRESGLVILSNGNVVDSGRDGFTYQTQVRPGGRPDLAGPYAFSRIPRPPDDKYKVYLNEDLHETWLFETINLRGEEEGSVTRFVPDALTSWKITAFSIHPLLGLVVTDEAVTVNVKKSFDVSLNVPHSLLVGESVSIQAVVFNHERRSLETEVSMNDDNGRFEFVDPVLGGRGRVTVPPNDSGTVTFVIHPKAIGAIDIKVTAKNSAGEDEVEKRMIVQPDGAPQFRSKGFLVDLTDSATWIEDVNLEIPSTAVKDSVIIEVSAIGDIMGPAISNAHQLVRLPTGCGEQNMVTFVPNVIVMRYLENIGQVTSSVEQRLKRHMEAGYQRQLAYRRTDDSFSTFGQSDVSGSTWLTAYVAKSMIEAQQYIAVDTEVIKKALNWLVGVQTREGGFPEVGKVTHSAIQKKDNDLGLTAYVILTMAASSRIFAQDYNNVKNLALNYVATRINTVSDPYTTILICYVLHMNNHPSKEACFARLQEEVIEEDETKHWEATDVVPPAANAPWLHQAVSFNVEITSYALMIYLQRGMLQQALPIVHWLIQQRNSLGGFSSTQDTVVGLTALAQYGQAFASAPSPDLDVTFLYEALPRKTFYVNTVSQMQLQKDRLLDPTMTKLQIRGRGRGRALVQINYIYHLNVTGAYPSFRLDPQLAKRAYTDKDRLQVNVCTNFLEEGESNMAIMDVSLPSGFVVDHSHLPSLRDADFVRRVETRDYSTGVVVYFDKITKLEVCPTILAHRVFAVADQMPVPVIVQDYYNHSRYARAFYQPYPASLCDICEGETCGNAICKGFRGGQGGGGGNGISPGGFTGSADALSRSLALIVCAVLLAILPRV